VTLHGQLIRIDDNTNENFYSVYALQASSIFRNEVPPGVKLDLAIRFANRLNRLTQAS
jgi:hypothetical protein